MWNIVFKAVKGSTTHFAKHRDGGGGGGGGGGEEDFEED